MGIEASGSFRQLDARQQHTVELKYLSKTHAEIAKVLSVKFNKPTSKSWVDKMFMKGGALQAALYEYRECLADEALLEAKALLPGFTVRAIKTLNELTLSRDKRVAVSAAKTLSTPAIAAISRNLNAVAPNPTAQALTDEIDREIMSVLSAAKL